MAGVHIDLIRGLCATLELPCTLQARRFDRVLSAVDQDPNNLILAAGLAVNEDTAQRLAFSLPYYRYAARFISLHSTPNQPDWMAGARIGVVENTAHAAFLQAAFGDVAIDQLPNANALRQALRRGDISHAFGDGLDLAFWMASPRSGDCCHFVGEPLFSRTYFGEGLTFAVPRGQQPVLQAINAGLVRLEASGELETIMLTAFPLDPLGQ